jgi:hypothetical protein
MLKGVMNLRDEARNNHAGNLPGAYVLHTKSRLSSMECTLPGHKR